MIDYSQNLEGRRWLERITGTDFSATPAVWLTSRDQKGRILGVVVFSRFTTGNCEVTVAARQVTRELIYASAAYVFTQLKYRRCTAFIAVDNSKSLRPAQRLGFRIEGTARSWFPSGDAYILGLLREDCKYVKDLEHGQPVGTSST